MPKVSRLWQSFVVILALLGMVACGAPAVQPQGEAGAAAPSGDGALTDVGTPRNETLIFQTFDRQTADPGNMNPMLAYAVWRGFRELGWGFLWETDTGTGESYGELAAGPAEALNDEHTQFRITLKYF